MRRVLLWGGDEISSYNIGRYGHASQYYTTTCFGPEHWLSSGCSQLTDQLHSMSRGLPSGGDEISSYNFGRYGHASKNYTTTCFGPGYWPSSSCSHLIDQLHNMRRVLLRGGGGRRDIVLQYWEVWTCLPILLN